MGNEPPVTVRELVFDYPGKRALSGVGFTLEPGSVTALVGPNGAGKSTLLRCLCALAMPYGGQVAVAGFDTRHHPREVHARVGYLSDFFGLYEALSVARCLLYAALSRGLTPSRAENRALEVARELGLNRYWRVKAGELSRGWRQRLAIAQALIHDPPLLLLDEPASGLDPEARAELSALLVQLRRAGKTIVVSSHILTELEDYSTHMLLLKGGRLVNQRVLEHPDAGVAGGGSRRARLRLSLAVPHPGAADVIAGQPGVAELAAEGERAFQLLFAGGAAERHALLKTLLDGGLPVCGLEEARTGMHQVYLEDVARHGGEGGQ